MSEQVVEQFVERIDAVFLPVKNLQESLKWYQDVFGFVLRWRNERMGGLAIAPNCGFHLVQVSDFHPINKYTPFNFAVKDVEEVRNRLQEKGVTVSGLRPGEPKRFDLTDVNGNMISVIQL
ncbi:VOC family protein [Cohnella silvisoli]|uniref:VOC family protein n=1 Tax=Cohnella silvisoli TaxID=2873699 RepID=A0ABV1KNV4_9BACL|nr:VOC family protein [Cohnella silvisoli]MCD9020191.1 VOC family protein [Cohnella silvisoli]